MCDYSLQGLPNRLAGEGEQLVTHRFPTQSIGLASPWKLLPGTIANRKQKSTARGGQP